MMASSKRYKVWGDKVYDLDNSDDEEDWQYLIDNPGLGAPAGLDAKLPLAC